MSGDLAALQKRYDDRLSTLPSMVRLTSTLVMKSVFTPTCLPIPDGSPPALRRDFLLRP